MVQSIGGDMESKEMFNKNNWNTWDARHPNAVLKLPEMAEVLVNLYDISAKCYREEFSWGDITRLGLHDPDGCYHELGLRVNGFEYDVEFGSRDDMFVYKITPKSADSTFLFHICARLAWSAKGSVSVGNDSLEIAPAAAGRFEITILGNIKHNIKADAPYAGIFTGSDRVVYVRCNNAMDVTAMDGFIADCKNGCDKGLVKGGGLLGGSPDAIMRGVYWNTTYEDTRGRAFTTLSRSWCSNIREKDGCGSFVLYTWDTAFAAILAGIQDRNAAYASILSIFDEACESGLIPNHTFETNKSYDRTAPPVLAYCVLKLYRQFGERELLECTFDKLLKWVDWLKQCRATHGNGPLELGSNPYPEGVFVPQLEIEHSATLQGAKWESGLDNSPMYDDATYDEITHTMRLADIGLNSLYAASIWAVSEMAQILGKVELASELSARYKRHKELINREMWDEKAGIYCNRYRDGRLSNRYSPTSFYPLMAGIATEERAERMVREHLLNEAEFWGEYVIPSISKSDPAFTETVGADCPHGGKWEPGGYWRGRIWGPMNFLVSEGLKRYGFHDAAYELAKKSLALFMKEWNEKNHIHENYNALTGEGCDVHYSTPVYTWGGLTAYLAIGEVIEAQPWAGLRLGNLSGEKASIENFPVGMDKYSVYVCDGLTVQVNGRPFFESDVPVLITGLIEKDGCLEFNVDSTTKGTLKIWPATGCKSARIQTRAGISEVAIGDRESSLNL